MTTKRYFPGKDVLVVAALSVATGVGIGLQSRKSVVSEKMEEARAAAGPHRNAQKVPRKKSIDELRLEERDHQWEEAGVYSIRGPGDLRLIREDGSVDDKVLAELGITGARLDVRDAITSARQRASEGMARRLQADSRRSSDLQEGWRALHIPGDLDGSAALLGNLRNKLEAASSKEKMESLMKALDAPSQLAYLGRSDVYIQVPEGGGDQPVAARIQFNDPVSGATLGGANLTDRKQLEDMLGAPVAASIFSQPD